MSSQSVAKAPVADRYRLQTPIGSGGMGTVWHAHDTLLKRDVAVKEVALPPLGGAEEREAIRKRVLREARAAAALNHPNAVTVFDVIEEDGNAFIVMELIDGRTLDAIVAEGGPLSDDRAAAIASDMLSALEAAHNAGIVHRDVKPANVMITNDGRTKLADFGIASVKDDPKITASGLILGSPSYMAPEQATHGRSGPEADMWGLGTTMYFALEGEPPFKKDGAIPTLTAVIDEEPRPMQRSSRLRPIVEALLTKDPAARPTTETTQRMLAHPAPNPTIRVDERARPTVGPARSPAPAQSQGHRSRWWLAAIAALLTAGIVAVALWDGRDDRETNGSKRDRAAAPGTQGDAAGEAADDTVAVPPSWSTYEHDGIGYTVRYPSDWTVEERDEKNTFFHAPNGTYLQVAWRQPPNPLGPEGAWEALAEDFAGRHPTYQEIRIDPTTFNGMDAAEWEFTYKDGGVQLHTLDLGFITTDGSTGMALLFQTHAVDWDSSRELFEQLKAGFRPPA